ncbi:MAG: SDR family oxidoreductase [Firmicutes bacterium]|nr:SDR family oxidoreductase [Bacillota bacterium]
MLKDKVAIITGGSSGVGFSTAKLFLENGAKVVITGRNREKLDKAVEELSKSGDVTGIAGDVSKENDVIDTVKKTIEKYSRIDILVNNAGTPLVKRMIDTNLDEWNEIFAIHSTGTFLMSKETVKWMIANKVQGSIVNVSSVSGVSGNAMATAYSGAKAAMIGFSKALAKEVAPYRITVNCVLPGGIDTEMFHEGSIRTVARMFNKPEEYLMKSTLSVIPLGRLLNPEEVGDLIMFIASDKGKGMTGEAYTISCGYYI